MPPLKAKCTDPQIAVVAYRKDAAVDTRAPAVGVRARQRQCADADLNQRAARVPGSPAVGNGSADFGAEIVQADCERL